MIGGLQHWRFNTRDGLSLSGWQTPPSGRTVLYFRHGNGFNGMTYWALLKRLQNEYDLVALDAQGHGDSEAGDFRGWNQAAHHGIEHLEELRQQRPDVMVLGLGHSFGGVLTALMIAERPDLLDAAILLDPVLFSPTLLLTLRAFELSQLTRRAHPLARMTLRRRRQWRDRDEALNSLQGRGIFRGWDGEALNSYVDHALQPADEGLVLKCAPETESAVFTSAPRGLWQALAKVRQPLHIIYGEASLGFIQRGADRARRRNSLISAEEVPGGHCFMLENPQSTSHRVIEVANGLLNRSRSLARGAHAGTQSL